MDWLFIAAIVVSAIALTFVMRGVDVRLVLFLSAVVLASFAGQTLRIFDTFFVRMGDSQVIGPICSAMGFSFVLRQTGCDREMVRLLIQPLRRYRWLLIPGGCIVGFITNMAITSQTAAAAAVGPILLPLMLAAGFHPLTAAATLVLGCSAGGNLFNPGEPDVVNVQLNAKVPVHDVIQSLAVPEAVGFLCAVVVFTWFRLRADRHRAASQQAQEADEKVNLIKALLPPLPVIMLFVLMPSFRLVPVVAEWYPDGFPVVHAMLISTMITMLVTRKDLSNLSKQFFEGLGYGYVQVISLIITASCFIEALKLCGVMETLVKSIASGGVFGYVSSAVSTMCLAFVSGSGTAPSIAFSKAVLPGLVQHGVAPEFVIDIGVLGAIGATFGRTFSPVAAIVIFASTLTEQKTKDIVKLTAPPLIIGLLIVLLLMILRVLAHAGVGFYGIG